MNVTYVTTAHPQSKQEAEIDLATSTTHIRGSTRMAEGGKAKLNHICQFLTSTANLLDSNSI